jgi:hypothetical protein
MRLSIGHMTQIKRLVRFYEWNIKTIIYVAVHDRPAGEAVIVGPTRYYTRRVLVVTGRDLSEAEVDRLVELIINSELRCSRCRRRGSYIKVDVKNGKPDLKTAICNDCEPTVGYALGAYEAFDVAFVETRGG